MAYRCADDLYLRSLYSNDILLSRSRVRVLRTKGQRSTHFFDGVLHNIARSHDLPCLTQTMNSIQCLFLCHWTPLRLNEVNFRCYSKIESCMKIQTLASSPCNQKEYRKHSPYSDAANGCQEDGTAFFTAETVKCNPSPRF